MSVFLATGSPHKDELVPITVPVNKRARLRPHRIAKRIENHQELVVRVHTCTPKSPPVIVQTCLDNRRPANKVSPGQVL